MAIRCNFLTAEARGASCFLDPAPGSSVCSQRLRPVDDPQLQPAQEE